MSENNEIYGLKFQDDLPENAIPVDAILIVKYLDGNSTSFLVTSSETLQDMEALGLLHAAMKMQESYIAQNWYGSEDE